MCAGLLAHSQSEAAAAPSQSQNSTSNWTFFRAELGILFFFCVCFGMSLGWSVCLPFE
jgi:hypothetical protein